MVQYDDYIKYGSLISLDVTHEANELKPDFQSIWNLKLLVLNPIANIPYE